MSVIYPETPGDGAGPRLRPTLDMFLSARYDELEETARSAGEHGRNWKAPGPGWGTGAVEAADPWPRNDTGIVVYDEGRPSEEQAAHIARHDPAYVLADIAAKRAIVSLHNRCEDWSYGDPSTCPELCALALPFSGHPDWREEWRP